MHIVLLPDLWNIMVVEIYFKIIPLLPFFFSKSCLQIQNEWCKQTSGIYAPIFSSVLPLISKAY